MINGVPTSTDFRNHGIDYLNIGWGLVLDLVICYADAEELTGGGDPDTKAGFWLAAERELATSLSLIEQGAEFLLKAKICEMSPWLLISRNPADWPRGSDRNNIEYAQFRTIDAQDLVKVLDTFATTRLPEDFVSAFETLRRERNSIMHTVNKNLRLSAASLVEKILVVSEHLIESQSWIAARREFVVRDSRSIIDAEYNEYRVVREFMSLVDLLTESQLKRFFGFSKRQRSYICPVCCHSNSDLTLACRTAILRPKTPKSTKLYCFICNTESKVERRDCKQGDCEGNVYDPEWDQCLTCLEPWP